MTGQPPATDVVCFPECDHVLEIARHALCGPTEESLRSMEAFFHPEDVDPSPLFEAGDIAGISTVGPSGAEGSVSKPPGETTILVVRRSKVTADLMESLPRLKHVQKLGARRDTVDHDFARRAGISTDFVVRPTLESTADHALMLTLAVARRSLEADRAVRQPARDIAGPYGVASYNWAGMDGIGPLYGRTLGIVGMGEVGMLVARRARAFGMDVCYVSPRPLTHDVEAALGARRVDLLQLLQESDVVSLHLPGGAANERLVDRDFLRRMRPGSILVNVSRGALVDDEALVAALREGRIAGAGLDVHASEPRAAGDPLLAFDQVVLSPHVAGGPHSAVFPEILAMLDGIRRAVQRSAGTRAGRTGTVR